MCLSQHLERRGVCFKNIISTNEKEFVTTAGLAPYDDQLVHCPDFALLAQRTAALRPSSRAPLGLSLAIGHHTYWSSVLNH